MKRIKVAQVITRMDRGGSPDIVRVLSQYLDTSRFDIVLICGSSLYPSEKTLAFFNDIKANLIQIKSLQRNIHPVFDLIALFKLYFIFRKHKFDIVHTHTAKAGALGRIAAFLAGIKTIIHTSHGHNFYGYFNGFISRLIVLAERFLAFFTTKIVTLTEIEKKDLLEFHICKASKIEAINTVLETVQGKNNLFDIKPDLHISDKAFVFGMVARLEPIKGVSYFIKAAIMLAEKFTDVHFLIVGEGSQRMDLEARVNKKSLSTRFSFMGWQSKPMLYMQAMDVLVLSSLNEAVGLVLLEAQSMGIPVIATKVGGIPEIVEDGKSGLLLEPQDVLSIYSAMENLLNNEKQRSSMKQYVIENTLNKYSPNNFIKNIERIYKQAISD